MNFVLESCLKHIRTFFEWSVMVGRERRRLDGNTAILLTVLDLARELDVNLSDLARNCMGVVSANRIPKAYPDP